jgi:TRAP-type C4-dicarboxylate transport system permease small subunit
MNKIVAYSDKVIRFLRITFVGISGLALLGLTLMTTADTFMRFVLNAPFPASVEISQLIQPYIVFLPFAYALHMGSHVRVTLITERFSGRVRLFLEFLPFLIGTIFFAVMTYISWIRFSASFRIQETMLAAIRLYWWVGKMAMPIGLGLMTLECLNKSIQTFNAIINNKQVVE